MIDFVKALEGWGIPVIVLIILAFIFVISNVIGSMADAAGKAVPMIFNLKKWFKERREERSNRKTQYSRVEQMLEDVKEQQTRVESLLTSVNEHYNADNISKRDKWMLEVNSTMHWCKERAEVYDASVEELRALNSVVKDQQTDLALNNKMTSEVYKQMTRTQILDFAHKIINARKADKPVIFSREEFRKIRKSYEAYEEFLDTFGGTNGEVDDAMNIIREAEAGLLPNIEFLEDLRD